MNKNKTKRKGEKEVDDEIMAENARFYIREREDNEIGEKMWSIMESFKKDVLNWLISIGDSVGIAIWVDEVTKNWEMRIRISDGKRRYVIFAEYVVTGKSEYVYVTIPRRFALNASKETLERVIRSVLALAKP